MGKLGPRKSLHVAQEVVLTLAPYMEARLFGWARASMGLLGPRKSLYVAHEVVLALDP